MRVLPSSLFSVLALLPLLASSSSSLGGATASRPRSNVAKNVLEHKPDVRGYCSPSGPIENTLCEYETLERVNEDLYSRLHNLVKTPFFKFYRVDLFKECPFWYENSFCMNRDCGVETADEDAIPIKWRQAALSSITPHTSPPTSDDPQSCYFRDQDFCQMDDESQNEGEYVDLSLNPERFTGYAGPSASRVWSSIYEENCFGLSELSAGEASLQSLASDAAMSVLSGGLSGLRSNPLTEGVGTGMREGGTECLEKRIYYRIISGLHASISTHICADYLDQETGEWAPNLECFITRIASHPDRLQNMYFNLVLMLRAVSRAAPYLEMYDVKTGDLELDRQSTEGIRGIVQLAKGDKSRGEMFDETDLFRGEDALTLKEEFKDRFRNVSRIMDCVGCDKCRLWGKIQVTGVATALKILFELDEQALSPKQSRGLLSRSEIVALFNTLHRFSESLHSVEDFRALYARTKAKAQEQRRHSAGGILPQPSPHASSDKGHRPFSTTYARFVSLLRACRASIWDCVEACVRPLESGGVADWLRNIWEGEEGPGGRGFGKSDL